MDEHERLMKAPLRSIDGYQPHPMQKGIALVILECGHTYPIGSGNEASYPVGKELHCKLCLDITPINPSLYNGNE